MNPKLLSPAQRKALLQLADGSLIRNQTGWTSKSGMFLALVTISRLRLLGLARNGRSGQCHLTNKGRETVSTMEPPK